MLTLFNTRGGDFLKLCLFLCVRYNSSIKDEVFLSISLHLENRLTLILCQDIGKYEKHTEKGFHLKNANRRTLLAMRFIFLRFGEDGKTTRVAKKCEKSALMLADMQLMITFAPESGRSSVRLEYASGGRVVAGSNPVTPTY